ncbi:MAG: TraB/GumN family protein, partial [Chthoniobacterales bacterium]|nr:TraB/GumN family protein [Chthoniobacterales bacterium]
MIRRAHGNVARICVFVCFATIAVQTATALRPFVIREKPYLANRLPFIPSPNSAPPPSTTKHCVWRVTNVPAPFYLVGTIHTLRVNDYPLAQVYGQTLRDSKRLLFEYNPKEDALYTKKFHDAGQYPPGQDIRSSIRRETLDLLLRNLTAFHLSFEEIKQYKPWALA